MDNEKKLQKVREQIDVVVGKLNDPNLCKGTMETQSRVSGLTN